MAELSTRAPDPDPERLPSPAWFKDQVAGADDALAEWAKDPTDRESSNTDKPKAAVNGGGHKPAVNSDRDRASTGSSEPAEAPRPAPRSGAAATDPGAPPSPRRGEQRPPDADPATGPGGDVDEPMHGPEPGKQTNKQTSEAPKSVDSTRNSARRTPMPRSLDRLFLTFYAVTLGLALWGQTLGLARILYGNQRVAELAAAPFLQRTAFFSLPLAFAFVIELLAALLLHWADWRRMTRLETSYVAYAFATLVAAAVAFLNWYGHLGGITGGLFAGASLTAFGMWVLRSYGRLKDALAERAALPDLPEDIPDPVARRARELSRRKPGESVWAYIETARTQLANEERHAAIRDALAARIGAAQPSSSTPNRHRPVGGARTPNGRTSRPPNGPEGRTPNGRTSRPPNGPESRKQNDPNGRTPNSPDGRTPNTRTRSATRCFARPRSWDLTRRFAQSPPRLVSASPPLMRTCRTGRSSHDRRWCG